MKNLIAITVVSIIACLGCRVSAETPLPLRVGSYNIRNSGGDKGKANDWKLRRGDMAALMKKLDLDVVGLQEVMPDQADYLCSQFTNFTMVGEYRNGPRRGEASSVFFRKDRFEMLQQGTFWLSETPEVVASISWNSRCTRVCTWVRLQDRKTGRKFCFANTHLDHVSAEARLGGMKLIAKRMKDFSAGLPVIFTGDHNCVEHSAPAQYMAKVLRNAVHCCETPVEGPWLSAPGWRYYDPATLLPATEALKIGSKALAKERRPGCDRIDYIYVSTEFKVKQYATHADERPGVKMYPSDHLPVTALLELR